MKVESGVSQNIISYFLLSDWEINRKREERYTEVKTRVKDQSSVAGFVTDLEL